MVSLLHRSKTTTESHSVKITLGETRETGVRDPIVFCADYKCSHNIKLAPAVVDQWPDDLRLSDLEPRFVCRLQQARRDPPIRQRADHNGCPLLRHWLDADHDGGNRKGVEKHHHERCHSVAIVAWVECSYDRRVCLIQVNKGLDQGECASSGSNGKRH
jgi:hypothetical protein